MRWIPFVMVRITAFLAGRILTAIFWPPLFAPEAATVFLIFLPGLLSPAVVVEDIANSTVVHGLCRIDRRFPNGILKCSGKG